jgi:hypothetical protein
MGFCKNSVKRFAAVPVGVTSGLKHRHSPLRRAGKKKRKKKGKTKEHTSKERNVRKKGNNIADLLSKQERDRGRKR